MSFGVRRLTLANRIRNLLIQSDGLSIQLPEKWKGGRTERWFNFWKQLAADYRQAGADAVQDCRDRPVRTAVYAMLAASTYALMRTNPQYNAFEDSLLSWQSDMCTVGSPVRKSSAYDHLLELTHLIAQRRLKRLDLGVCTLLFRQENDESVATFSATCSYLQPTYWNYLSERLVDIGIANRWLMLHRQLRDFDVNELEWTEEHIQNQHFAAIDTNSPIPPSGPLTL